MKKLISNLSTNNRWLIFNFIPIIKKREINKKCYSKYLDLYYPDHYTDWKDIRDIYENNQEILSHLNNFLDLKDYRKIIHNIYLEIIKQNVDIKFQEGFTDNDTLKLYSIIGEKMNIDLMTFIYIFPFKNSIIKMIYDIFNKKNLYNYLVHPTKRYSPHKKYIQKKYYDFLYILCCINPNIKNINEKKFNSFTKKINIVSIANFFILKNTEINYVINKYFSSKICEKIREKYTLFLVNLLLKDDGISLLNQTFLFLTYTSFLVIIKIFYLLDKNFLKLFFFFMLYSSPILFLIDIYLKKKYILYYYENVPFNVLDH
tara:strand:+ start:945 stop:1892 length:948 start_codon:yes stop_codon:yes gene_type:complete